MTETIRKKLDILQSETYKSHRYAKSEDITAELSGKCAMMQSAYLLSRRLQGETPRFFDDDRFGCNRHQIRGAYSDLLPDYGGGGNITPDYETLLRRGLDGMREDLLSKKSACTPEQAPFYDAALLALDAAIDYADRQRDAAKTAAPHLAEALSQVPRKPARTLQEALISVKFLQYTLRLSRCNHIGFGRFDRYLLPYYEHDLARGVTREALLELVEDFFISVNLDSDLYFGVQKGDNGQSLVLGGCDREGNDAFTDFTKLCMEASLEVKLIDPKINLRVNKDTPMEILEFATHMTKQGLGFPQYCNDDVVIPGLVKLGYPLEDARDYVVAACWEFIIPFKGQEVPNIKTMNFPLVVEKTVSESLTSCKTFDELLSAVRKNVEIACNRLMENVPVPSWPVNPWISLFVRGCMDSGKDVSQHGGIYNNYGVHGAGIATAADSLAAIRETVFETKEVTAETLLSALAANFEGFGALRNRLLSCPKMGNNDSRADELGDALMDAFASSLNKKPNGVGGIFRAGTGSAMEYFWSAEKVGATADGRKAAEPYGSSFSPSLECRLSGPLSCIKSFTRFDMTRIINGGPLTLEIHASTFRNEDGIKKVAQLVKAFLLLGGHQLQLNAVNRDTLLDAREHPEKYKNLIVRVWGWSGYFTELEPKYQEHIIRRTEFTA